MLNAEVQHGKRKNFDTGKAGRRHEKQFREFPERRKAAPGVCKTLHQGDS